MASCMALSYAISDESFSQNWGFSDLVFCCMCPDSSDFVLLRHLGQPMHFSSVWMTVCWHINNLHTSITPSADMVITDNRGMNTKQSQHAMD